MSGQTQLIIRSLTEASFHINELYARIEELTQLNHEREQQEYRANFSEHALAELIERVIINQFSTGELVIDHHVLRGKGDAVKRRPGRRSILDQKQTLQVDEARIWLVMLLRQVTHHQTYEAIRLNYPWLTWRKFREAQQNIEALGMNGRNPAATTWAILLRDLRQYCQAYGKTDDINRIDEELSYV